MPRDDFLERKLREWALKGLAAAAGIFIWSGILFFVAQVVSFLYKGEWPAMPLLVVLDRLGVEWASNPLAWLGVHKACSYLSFPASLLMGGIFSLYIGHLISEGA